MSKWQSGPPPAVGWWPASTNKLEGSWRWWNGSEWSIFVYEHHSAEEAASCAALVGFTHRPIAWHDWPEHMRHLPGYPLRSE